MDRRLAAGDVSVLVGPQSGNITHGDVDGIYNTALFYDPTGSSLSSDNSYLLVTDSGNHKIRKVVLSTKVVSTLVGPPQGTTVTSGTTNGVGTNVRFTEPVGIRLSPDNSFALVAEYGHKIRKIVISTLTVTTIAGGSTSGLTDGQGTSSKFNYPSDICISSDATFALITDTGSHRVRKLTISTGAVVGFVGSNVGSSGSSDGTGTNSRFNGPYGIALIPGGTYVLLTDTINKLIRKVVISTLVVTTLAGSTSSSGTGDGIGTNAKLYSPYGIDISSDSSYAMFVGGSYRLRKLTLSTNAVTSFAGQSLSGDVAGTGTNAMFNFPTSVCIFSDLGWFVVVDKISNKVKLVAALASSTFTPTFTPSVSPTHQPSSTPSVIPTFTPSVTPTLLPSSSPSISPTNLPTFSPTLTPTVSFLPSSSPTTSPSESPTLSPITPSPSFLPSMTSSTNPPKSSDSSSSDSSSSIVAIAVAVPLAGVAVLGGAALLYWYRFLPSSSSNSVKVYVAPSSSSLPLPLPSSLDPPEVPESDLPSPQ